MKNTKGDPLLYTLLEEVSESDLPDNTDHIHAYDNEPSGISPQSHTNVQIKRHHNDRHHNDKQHNNRQSNNVHQNETELPSVINKNNEDMKLNDPIYICLHYYFNIFVNIGFNVRSHGLNSQNEWKNTSMIIPTTFSFDETRIKWSPATECFWEMLKSSGIGTNDQDPNFESNYIILQVGGGIVKNNPEFSVRKLLEIAYNIGQVTFERQIEGIYTNEQLELFDSMKMNLLSTHIEI